MKQMMVAAVVALSLILKPAGRDLGPAIPAADEALEGGSVDALTALLTGAAREHLRTRFDEARAARTYDPRDVDAGRRYVHAYVEFIHYVERMYEAATTEAHGHFEEADAR